MPPDEGIFVWKHHAHVHMVAIAPRVPRKSFVEFCTILQPLGLGRITYNAPGGVGARKKVAAYISKYLVKEKTRSVTFGILRHRCP